MAENDDRELTEEEQAREKRKARRKQRIKLTVLALLLVALSSAVTVAIVHFMVGGGDASGAPQENGEAEEESETPVEEREAIYFPFEQNFVINYDVRGRQRYLQVEVNLMLRDEEVVPALEEHQPKIRNELIMLFSGQEFEALQTPEGRELLRQDAVREVQSVLEEETGEPGIEQVLFSSFVMQ